MHALRSWRTGARQQMRSNAMSERTLRPHQPSSALYSQPSSGPLACLEASVEHRTPLAAPRAHPKGPTFQHIHHTFR